MKDLKGKVTVITGGGSGIGFALAETALGEGMFVAMTGTNREKLESAVERLGPQHKSSILARIVDVTDEPGMDKFADEVFAWHGEVHLLCCNAGVTARKRVIEMNLDDLMWVVKTNLGGTQNTLRAFVPRMLKQPGEKHVLYSGSMASVYAPPREGLSPYVASKMGSLGLSMILEHEIPLEQLGQTFAFIGSHESDMMSSAASRRPGRNVLTDPMNRPTVTPASVASRIMIDAVKANRRYIATEPHRLPQIVGPQEQWRAAFKL